MVLVAGSLAAAAPAAAQPPTPSIGQRVGRLLITNVSVIDGMGNPLRGPMDITIEGGKLIGIVQSREQEFSGSVISNAPPPRAADRTI